MSRSDDGRTWSPEPLDPDAEVAPLQAVPVGSDRYAVEELLGTGAMGEIYRVLDGGLAERRVGLCTRRWQDPRHRHNLCGTRRVRPWP